MSVASRRAVRTGATWLAWGLAACAFAAGVQALVAAGRWAGFGWASFTVPLFVDGYLILSGAAWAAERLEKRSGLRYVCAIAGTVVLSAGLQVVHAWSTTTATTRLQVGVALVVSVLPPVITMLSVETALDLLNGRPAKRGQRTALRPEPEVALGSAPSPAVPATRPKSVAKPRAAEKGSTVVWTPELDAEIAHKLATRTESERVIAERLETSRRQVQNAAARHQARVAGGQLHAVG